MLPQGIKVGKVVGFDEGYILVTYTDCIFKENGRPYLSHEIESAVKFGEQLMLFDI